MKPKGAEGAPLPVKRTRDVSFGCPKAIAGVRQGSFSNGRPSKAARSIIDYRVNSDENA
jgi:hypothetical protein